MRMMTLKMTAAVKKKRRKCLGLLLMMVPKKQSKSRLGPALGSPGDAHSS